MQPCILKTSKKSAQLEWRGWTKSSQNWGINYTHSLSRKCHIPREFPETVWAKKKTWRQFAWKFTPKASTPQNHTPILAARKTWKNHQVCFQVFCQKKIGKFSVASPLFIEYSVFGLLVAVFGFPQCFPALSQATPFGCHQLSWRSGFVFQITLPPCPNNHHPRKLQHTPGAHPRQSPYPTMKRFPLQLIGKGLGVCSKGALKQPCTSAASPKIQVELQLNQTFFCTKVWCLIMT